jgi:CheY-like chemotaxis protein/HPt (histidine-containing phosphotransfer) domain-containing protein
MTEEQIGQLFDEYSRFQDDTDVAIEGTGLGLPITHRLLRLMDGEIQVESEPEKGSLFTVRLPQEMVEGDVLGKELVTQLKQCRTAPRTSKKQTQIVRHLMPYGNVLVVDDMEPNIYVAVRLMKPYGLKIDTAMSGREAIDKIKGGKVYDVVFMDHMMPGMNGMETTKHLREWGYTTPIVALTANAAVGQEQVFLQNGFDAFISKPIDIRQLNSVLNKLIRDKQPATVIEGVHQKIDSEEVEHDGASQTSVLLAERKITGLNIAEGLERFDGDEKTHLKLLRSYASSVRSLLGSIEIVNENTLKNYEIAVHGIKGASFDILAEQVGKKSHDLEQAAKNGDFKFVVEHNPTFLETTWQLVHDLENLFFAIEAANPRPIKARPDNEALLKLLVACKEYDMDGADTAMAEIDNFRYESDDGLVDWLRDNVDVMNFEDIVERLSSV